MLATGDFIEYRYKDRFDYNSFCKEMWPVLSDHIRFPTKAERDLEYESIWEDLNGNDCRLMVLDMLESMGVSELDGKRGFTFVDQLGYVECLGELGDDGKRYCTLTLPVDGVLCIRPYGNGEEST